jgi:ABC-type transport system substrate-binding protein
LSVIKEVTVKKPMGRWSGLLLLAAILVVAALLLGACGSSSSSSSASPTAQETPKPGGTYNMYLGSDPLSIEPLNVQEAEAAQITHQVFQGLYMYQQQPDGTTQAVPDLLEKQEVSADAKTFTFTIKQGVMFAPPVSREVKAQDFVDSWNYMLDPKNQSALAGYIFQPLAGLDPDTGVAFPGKEMSSLKVVDDYTFTVELKASFAQFPQTLVYDTTKVIPVDYARKVGLKAFADKPVGTGPYMVDEWKHGKYVRLVKNPEYWNADGASGNSAGAGYVDDILFTIYNDINTEYLAFQKGDLDVAGIPPGNFISAQQFPEVKSGEWTVKAYPNTGVYFIGVSMNKPMLGGPENLPIRAALNMAADREAVSNIVNQGVSIPSDSIVPVSIPGYQPGNNPYPTDPTKAQAKLDEFTGTLPQNIPFWFNSGAGHDKIAQALVAGWTKALPSLTFKLNGIETNAYWTGLSENKPPALFRMGWVADYALMDNFIYLFTKEGGSYGSYTWYYNPKVDELFNQARQTMDNNEANAIYNEAEKVILADAPCVPLYTYRDARISNSARIGGFNWNAFALTDMWSVWVK